MCGLPSLWSSKTRHFWVFLWTMIECAPPPSLITGELTSPLLCPGSSIHAVHRAPEPAFTHYCLGAQDPCIERLNFLWCTPWTLDTSCTGDGRHCGSKPIAQWAHCHQHVKAGAFLGLRKLQKTNNVSKCTNISNFWWRLLEGQGYNWGHGPQVCLESDTMWVVWID